MPLFAPYAGEVLLSASSILELDRDHVYSLDTLSEAVLTPYAFSDPDPPPFNHLIDPKSQFEQNSDDIIHSTRIDSERP